MTKKPKNFVVFSLFINNKINFLLQRTKLLVMYNKYTRKNNQHNYSQHSGGRTKICAGKMEFRDSYLKKEQNSVLILNYWKKWSKLGCVIRQIEYHDYIRMPLSKHDCWHLLTLIICLNSLQSIYCVPFSCS